MGQDRKRDQKRVEIIKSVAPFSTDVANVVEDFIGKYYDDKYDKQKDMELLAEAKAIDPKSQKMLKCELMPAEKLAILAIHFDCLDTLTYLLDQKLVDSQSVFVYKESNDTHLPLNEDQVRCTMLNETLLLLAIRIKRFNIANLLLDNYPVKETINAFLNSNYMITANTPLCQVIYKEADLQLIKKLLDNGATPCEMVIFGKGIQRQESSWSIDRARSRQAPIFVAIRGHKFEIVQLFLAYNRKAVIFKDDTSRSSVDCALDECLKSQIEVWSKVFSSINFSIARLLLQAAAFVEGGDEVVRNASERHVEPTDVTSARILDQLNGSDVAKLFNEYLAFIDKRAEFQRLWNEEKGTEFEKVISCLKKISGATTSQLYGSSPMTSVIKNLEQNADQFTDDSQALLDYLQKIEKPAPEHVLAKMLFFLEAKLMNGILDMQRGLEYRPAVEAKANR
ncbi:MAG: hypothetical protein ACYCQI_06510 [Gammaproteobacteria bacterium]